MSLTVPTFKSGDRIRVMDTLTARKLSINNCRGIIGKEEPTKWPTEYGAVMYTVVLDDGRSVPISGSQMCKCVVEDKP